MAEVIFHVGLPKTGTTFLQKEIFPRLPINYKLYWSSKPFTIKSHTINLLSCESLSGNPLGSMRYGGLERDVIAHGLSEMFPTAKIIVGLRSKPEWMNSLYSQAMKQGYTKSKVQWYKDFDNNYLNFSAYINLLRDLFSDVYVYQFEDLVSNKQKFIEDICRFIGVSPPEYENKKYNASWSDKKLLLGKFRSGAWKLSRELIERL